MEGFTVAENRMFRIEGHDFLFLPADKAVFEMDRATSDLLHRWAEEKDLTDIKALAALNGTDEEKMGLLRHLAKLRVLAPLTAAILPAAGRVPQYGDIPLKTLILHVTEACNLNCLYCYYGNEDAANGIRGSSGNMKMSVGTARAAVEFLLAHSGDLREVGLVFFGGEPLLNFKLITETVAYAERLMASAGKRITFSLTTNATLLTPEVIAFLRAHRIGVTVSMDGQADVHDRYRRFPDGSGSYHHIHPKVQALLRTLGAPVPARVTLVKSPGNLLSTLDHLLGMGFAEVGFSPVTTGDETHQFSETGLNELLAQFKVLAEKFLTHAYAGSYLGFSNLTDLLVSLHGHELKNYPCGAGLGLFSVSHEGRLYLCQRFTGRQDYCMGDLAAGFDREKLQAFRSDAEISRKAQCRKCWARTLCTGGCYHEACVREGDLLKPNLHYCKWIQQWIETGLSVYGRLAVHCPEYLDKLAVMRGQKIDC